MRKITSFTPQQIHQWQQNRPHSGLLRAWGPAAWWVIQPGLSGLSNVSVCFLSSEVELNQGGGSSLHPAEVLHTPSTTHTVYYTLIRHTLRVHCWYTKTDIFKVFIRTENDVKVWRNKKIKMWQTSTCLFFNTSPVDCIVGEWCVPSVCEKPDIMFVCLFVCV